MKIKLIKILGCCKNRAQEEEHKASRRKEVRIRAETGETENSKIEKIDKTKISLFYQQT